MNIFSRPQYVSEITQFINELKAKNPAMEEGQRQGRSLLWDKAIDRDASREFGAARVPQKPYVYQNLVE